MSMHAKASNNAVEALAVLELPASFSSTRSLKT
jgi:hypothetical protein